MVELADDLVLHARRSGAIDPAVTRSDELSGLLLQGFTRLYWMTGDDRYLDFAIQLGEHFLLGPNRPRGTERRCCSAITVASWCPAWSTCTRLLASAGPTEHSHALWKSQGLTAEPWREDLRIGAVREAETLYMAVSADAAWRGRVRFDRARHALFMGLPQSWPRINELPEWYTVDPETTYLVLDVSTGDSRPVRGRLLSQGLELEVAPGRATRLTVAPER